jgi:hypothetical protein
LEGEAHVHAINVRRRRLARDDTHGEGPRAWRGQACTIIAASAAPQYSQRALFSAAAIGKR